MALPAKRTLSGAGPSDAALVVSARAGEPWAKEALFRRHARMVNGLVYRLTGRDADVDDLVQESFAQALANLDQLENPQAFAAWMSGIVVRTTHKVLRRRRLLSRLGLRASTPVDVESIAGRSAPPDVIQELRAVYGAMERMAPELRVALVLRRIEGLPLDEVATLVSASLSTVKRRLALAELELRRFSEKGDRP
jgi:RNA polymerase sigma-70 factor (ECF subfamily)